MRRTLTTAPNTRSECFQSALDLSSICFFFYSQMFGLPLPSARVTTTVAIALVPETNFVPRWSRYTNTVDKCSLDICLYRSLRHPASALELPLVVIAGIRNLHWFHALLSVENDFENIKGSTRQTKSCYDFSQHFVQFWRKNTLQYINWPLERMR